MGQRSIGHDRSRRKNIAESVAGGSPCLMSAFVLSDLASLAGEVLYQNIKSLRFYGDLSDAEGFSSEVLLRHLFRLEGDSLLWEMLQQVVNRIKVGSLFCII